MAGNVDVGVKFGADASGLTTNATRAANNVPDSEAKRNDKMSFVFLRRGLRPSSRRF